MNNTTNTIETRDTELESIELCTHGEYERLTEGPFAGLASHDDGPEWLARNEFGDADYDREIVTVAACELFGNVTTPEGYERIGAWLFNPEAECGCNWHTGEEGPADPDCPLCDGDGTLYMGEGMREIVYRKIWADGRHNGWADMLDVDGDHGPELDSIRKN